MDIIELESKVREESFRYMLEYFKATGCAPSMSLFSRRFAKRVKPIGKSIEDIMREDDRFVVTVNPKTGGYMITPTDLSLIGL